MQEDIRKAYTNAYSLGLVCYAIVLSQTFIKADTSIKACMFLDK